MINLNITKFVSRDLLCYCITDEFCKYHHTYQNNGIFEVIVRETPGEFCLEIQPQSLISINKIHPFYGRKFQYFRHDLQINKILVKTNA